MQKLLERFTRERLEALIEDEDCRVTVTEQETLAQIALAVMGGKCAVIPDGWKMVPLEATPEMLNESWVKCAIHHPTAYRVMIAAAPKPE